MLLGLLVESQEGLDWQHWRATCRHAERLGFASLWLSDHLASSWAADRHGLDPWIALSVAAAEMSRPRLGPLVSPITFRPPALVARMAESLAQLSGDRFVLGLGLGWNAAEHARFGLDFPSLADRVDRLERAIHTIRQVLGQTRVPLLLGGAGPRSTLPLVARYADQWNMTTSSPAAFAERAGQLDDLCHAVGRAPRSIQRSIATGLVVGRDLADLVARAVRLAERVPPLADALAAAPRATDAAGAGAAVIAAAQAIGWLAGTPDLLRMAIDRLAAVGVDEVMLGVYDLDDVAALELIGEELLMERS